MKKLVVLGGGESGVGTAILGKKKGYDVFVSDFGKIKDNYREVLAINNIKWEDEQHTEDLDREVARQQIGQDLGLVRLELVDRAAYRGRSGHASFRRRSSRREGGPPTRAWP